MNFAKDFKGCHYSSSSCHSQIDNCEAGKRNLERSPTTFPLCRSFLECARRKRWFRDLNGSQRLDGSVVKFLSDISGPDERR